MRAQSLFPLVLALGLQGQPETESPAPAPTPFEGTLGGGLAEVQRLARAGEPEPALELADRLLAPTEFLRWRAELEGEGSRVVAPLLDLADPLLERMGLNGYPEELRAEVHFAKGVVRLEAEERVAAEDDFGRAWALAGPGELRLDAGYDRGTAALLEGEVWRAQIPEIAGAGAAPPAGPPVAPVPAAPVPSAEEEDPLEVARRHYLRARESLVERLRAEWRDADTRANVELVQRRLRELDELERQREEQQQQDQQQDSQGEDQERSGDESQQDPSQPPDSEGQEQDPEEQPEEPEQPAESEGEEPEPEEREQEGEPPEDAEGEPADEAAQPEIQEVYLTREELQRLLDQLKEHEREGEAVRARLYQQSRRRVERDW